MNYIDTYKKGKVIGTAYDDEINVSAYAHADKNGNEIEDKNKKLKGLYINAKTGTNYITATKYKDTIIGGNDSDYIYSSLGNDKIKAGKGENTIIYSGNFDNDTITLTKSEELTIDLTSYGFSDIDDISYNISGKNLKITVQNYGTITLKNFAKSNVTKSGYVKILLNDDILLNLNSDLYLSYDNEYFSKKGKFTGSRFSERIDASKMERGVTISAKGGYNTIIGTDGYTDKISGGNDGNNITTGSGNKTITTGSGNDVITVTGAGVHKINAGNGDKNIITVTSGTNTIKTGKGNDDIYIYDVSTTTIYAGAGENNIYIDNSDCYGAIKIMEQKVNAINNIILSNDIDRNYILYKSGKNLVIKNEETLSTLTLHNYYSNAKKHSTTNFLIKGIEMSLDDIISESKGFVLNGKGTITGTDSNDVIIANDYTGKKSSNDIIYSGKGTDTINAGKGLNSIYLYDGDGTKYIVNGGGDDILIFEDNTQLEFTYNNEALYINYGNENDNIILNNFKNSLSAKYIQIGSDRTYIGNLVQVLERGSSRVRMDNITESGAKLILTNTFDDKVYEYTIKSTSGEQSAEFEYLSNGRLVINGNHLEITANKEQKDDIILLGNNNKLETNDYDDIVRIGYVIDANGQYYLKESSNNTIITGAGNDYVMYYGDNNLIDTGGDYDKIGVIRQTAEITNCEEVRNLLSNTEYDNCIGWFNQGGAGGDCRLFVLLDSLERSSDDFNLSDYIDISKTDNEYTVKFKKYNSENNSVKIKADELTDFKNIKGDLDTVLIDYAMNKLCEENKSQDKQLLEEYAKEKYPEAEIEIYELNTVQKAYYNTISNYIFGTEDITIINYNDSRFKTCLNELWNEYTSGRITNITVGIQTYSHDFKLGILTGHAYTVANLTDTYITLINPWDNADHLTLDINKFYRLAPCLVVYGTDYYGDALIQDNGFTSLSNEFLLDKTNYDITSWTTSQTDTNMINFNTVNDNQIITPVTDYIESNELIK